VTGFWWYLTFIGGMIGCSVGLPYPEEAVLLTAGYAAHKPETGVELVPAMLVCGFGVLLGDSLIYSLGRYVGPPVLQRWPFRDHFTPRRVRRARLQFKMHGGKILFPIRVVPVLRAAAHFTAGTLHYSYWRFLLWDGLGTALVVPLSVWLAYYFGKEIEQVVQHGKFWVGVLAGAGLGAWVVWMVARRRLATPATIHDLPTQILDTRRAAPAAPGTPVPPRRKPEPPEPI
jgi:membrane protein DedA with SNARE-associated domain